MGNVNMEATQIIYRDSDGKKSVAEALDNIGSGGGGGSSVEDIINSPEFLAVLDDLQLTIADDVRDELQHTIMDELQDLQAGLDAVEYHINDVERDLQQLDSGIDYRLDGVDGALADLNRRVTALEDAESGDDTEIPVDDADPVVDIGGSTINDPEIP